MAQTLLFKGTLNGITVFIHGEQHLNINNTYYERVSQTFKPSDLIFVEHSSNACEIKPEEEHLFQQFAKGSEWIFYTQKKAGNPNVVCFDTRAVHGYLNAFQEKRLLDIGNKLGTAEPQEIKEYIDGVMHSIKAVSDNEDKFDAFPGYFDSAYNTLRRQLNVCINILRIKKKEGAEFSDILTQVLSGVGYILASNIKRVGSVSTDISLAAALMGMTSNMNEGTVHVFCGRNQLVRMSELLPFSEQRGAISEEDRFSARMGLEGEEEEDEKLISIKSSKEFML